MFLAWYEKAVDAKEHIVFQRRTFAHDGMRNHLPHFHGGIEIVFAVTGDFEAFINEEKKVIHSGEICFADSFDTHRYHYKAGNECYVVVINADYFDGTNGLKDITFPHFNEYREGFDKIKDFLDFSYANWDSESLAFKSGFVDMLIGLLKRYYPVLNKLERPKNDEVMVDAVKYINENSRKAISIDELAAKFGYTPNYFSNIFNRFMGMGFREYLNWCRMLDYTRLKQKQPDVSAVKAAEICGFGSIKSFYRAKKMYESGIPDVWHMQHHKLF